MHTFGVQASKRIIQNRTEIQMKKFYDDLFIAACYDLVGHVFRKESNWKYLFEIL